MNTKRERPNSKCQSPLNSRTLPISTFFAVIVNEIDQDHRHYPKGTHNCIHSSSRQLTLCYFHLIMKVHQYDRDRDGDYPKLRSSISRGDEDRSGRQKNGRATRSWECTDEMEDLTWRGKQRARRRWILPGVWLSSPWKRTL